MRWAYTHGVRLKSEDHVQQVIAVVRAVPNDRDHEQDISPAARGLLSRDGSTQDKSRESASSHVHTAPSRNFSPSSPCSHRLLLLPLLFSVVVPYVGVFDRL